MEFRIEQYPGSTVAGFHKVGPWDQTVHEGFEQLALWVKNQHIHQGEWLAVYYDNPDKTPPEKLRCDTVITVDIDYVLPNNSGGVIKTAIASGEYAVARAKVDDDNFSRPWLGFFDAILGDDGIKPSGKPCFEHYLNEGSESGVWEFDMYVPIERQ